MNLRLCALVGAACLTLVSADYDECTGNPSGYYPDPEKIAEDVGEGIKDFADRFFPWPQIQPQNVQNLALAAAASAWPKVAESHPPRSTRLWRGRKR